VADDLRLGDLGQLRRLRAAEPLRQLVLRDVERGRHEGAPAREGLLVDGARAVALLVGLDDRRAARMRLVGLDAGVCMQAVRAHAAIASRSTATAAPSTSASRSMSAFERCSVIATSSPSSSSGWPGLTPSAAQRSLTLSTGAARFRA